MQNKGKTIEINAPFTKEIAETLRAGDRVLLSGVFYTGRDAAHKRLCEALEKGEELPFNIKDSVIYYVGPTPNRQGQAIGSAGPTTSSRMDAYAPLLIQKGLRAMIGKGFRSKPVIDAIIENKAIYFGAIGGAGALLSRSIIESEVIAYEDLGTEAIRRLKAIDFPATVVIDSKGQDLYSLGPRNFKMNRDS